MTQLKNPLVTGALAAYVTFLKTRLDADDNAAALESALRAFDSGVSGEVVKQRLSYILNESKKMVGMTNGEATVTSMLVSGTGYTVGDIIPITGTGSGGHITVLALVAGVSGGISTFGVSGGYKYTGTPIADSTGVGNADATFVVAVNDQLSILEATITAINAA